jgi:acyl carrier protein
MKNIENKVISVISKVLKEDVDIDTSRKNSNNWDSLKHIEVIFAIEDEFEIEFTEEEMYKMNNVSSFVRKLSNEA